MKILTSDQGSVFQKRKINNNNIGDIINIGMSQAEIGVSSDQDAGVILIQEKPSLYTKCV